MGKTLQDSIEELASDAAIIILKDFPHYLALFLSNSSLEKMDTLRHSFELAIRKFNPGISLKAANNGRISYNDMLLEKQANPSLLFVIYETEHLKQNRHEIISRSYHLDIEASLKILTR